MLKVGCSNLTGGGVYDRRRAAVVRPRRGRDPETAPPAARTPLSRACRYCSPRPGMPNNHILMWGSKSVG